MNSESGKSYLERLKEKNTPPMPQEAPPPQVKMAQISEADFERLMILLENLERLEDSEWQAEQSIQALQKSMDESAKELTHTMHELSQTTEKQISRAIARSEEQVGKTSERVSDFIWRRAQREDALWWLKLILFALPLILFLLSWVRWGFLDLAMA